MAIITTEQRNELLGLIVTMFQAAPGEQALGDVVGAFEAGTSLEGIAEALSTKALFNDVYSATQTADEFADAAVAWLLPASTPTAALTWSKGWILERLAEGEDGLPKASLKASVLLEAARALMATDNPNYADAQALMLNRIEVSNYYSVTQLQPTTTLPELQAVLDLVTADPASVQDAKDDIDSKLAGLDLDLTVGVDNLTGGSGADTFTAQYTGAAGGGIDATTFSGFDKLDGGKGNDTLNIYSDGSENVGFPSTASVTNIETINVLNDTAGGFGSIDAAKFVGATAINQSGRAYAVSNLAAGTTAGFNTLDGKGMTVDTASGVATVAVTLANVDDAAGATLALNTTSASKLSTVTISGSNVVNGDEVLDVTVGNSETTLTLNTSVDVNLVAAGVTAALEAGASTGGIAFNASAVATVNTGSGDDTLTLNTGLALEVNAGAGDDRVILSGGIGGLTADDSVDGGDGHDTVEDSVFNGTLTSGAAIVLANYLKNFEGLEFTNASGIDIASGSDLAAFTEITFSGGTSSIKDATAAQQLSTSQDLTADGTTELNITATAASITIDASAPTVNLTVDNAGGAVTLKSSTTTTANELKVATVTLVDAADGVTVNTADAVKLTTLTLSGEGTATVDADVSGALTAINAGALEGGLTFTSNNIATAETITLGAGADSVDLTGSTSVNASFAGMDTIVNFDVDNDILILGAGSAFSVVTVSGSSLQTAVQTLGLSTTATDDYAVFTYNGDAYVYVDVGNDNLDGGDLLVKLVGISSAADLATLAAAIV